MPAYHVHIRRFVCLLLMTSMVNTAVAGISFFVNDQRVTPNEMAVRYCFDPSTDYRLSRFFALQPQLAPLPGTGLDMSYKNGMFWISIDLSAFRLADSQIYAELHNPHINFLGAWLLRGDSVVRDFGVTGDHMPFHTRDVDHPQFVYHLDLRQKDLRLVLMIDKRNEQLHIPLKFLGEDQFLKDNRVGNVLAGLMTGISIFILLFTLFLYFNIREKLYIYYALYVLMVAGYIFSDLGYSFMYFYPDRPGLADFARPLTISLGPLFYIIFSRELLRVREYFPRMYRFTNWYIGFFLLCFACGFGLVPNTGTIRIFWLVFMQVLMVVSILPVFVFAVMGWRRNIKYSGYIIFASSLFTFFTQLYMQYITGNTADNLFTRNAVSIGFSIEISLLALALSIRFKNYKLDAEDLLRKLNRQQENIFKNISEYQEKEMRRISALLHDSVGAGLSSIKFNLEAIENGNGSKNRHDLIRGTIDDVTNLTDEIRNISHNLSPLLLQKKGLVQGIRDLIGQYNRTGLTHIHLESIGSRESASFQNELLVFRIVQELLHNAVKHARATEIIIQIMIEPELISLFVEDNGRGFDAATISDGLGFSQIRGLITFVSGRFEIDSQLNKGCRISIEFPTIPDESTDKSFAGRRSPYVS